jgi:hypothetical protein
MNDTARPVDIYFVLDRSGPVNVVRTRASG